jgi:rSAM/selenodomain-associated transferase 2
MKQISVIVPVLNEESTIEPTLRTILDRRDEADIEVIVADGGSGDRTVALARRHARVVIADRGKARQMNAAAREAQGEILFFVHADMELPPGALAAVNRAILTEGFDGGGFSNVFSQHNDRIKRLGRSMNLRLRDNDHARNTVFFGDNGIFVRRKVFEALGGFRDIPIMEDFDFSNRLRAHYRVLRLQSPRLIVSPRRHERAGFVWTRLQWILVKRLYLLGCPPRLLARLYPDVR